MSETAGPFYARRSATLANIAGIVGVDAALRLSAQFGGRRLTIPVTPKETSPVVKMIGLDAAKLLSRAMGGYYIEVPLSAGKRVKVVMLRAIDHNTVAEIAAKLTCSERYVYGVLADHAVCPIVADLALPPDIDPNQGDLFAATAESA